jgi:hypothetical protein
MRRGTALAAERKITTVRGGLVRMGGLDQPIVHAEHQHERDSVMNSRPKKNARPRSALSPRRSKATR